MIRFINTGLDERIVKSFNPKVIKPIPVHIHNKVVIENRPVNADIVTESKQKVAKQAIDPKIHPLIANANYTNDWKEDEKLSILLSSIVETKIENGHKIVSVDGEDMTPVEVSKLVYTAEEKLKQYHPLVANAPFKEGHTIFDLTLSNILGKRVRTWMKNYTKRFLISSDDPDEEEEVLYMEEMTERVKQAEKETAERIKHNKQYFTQSINELLLKAVYEQQLTYDVRLTNLFGTVVHTTLRQGKPVVLIDNEPYNPEDISKKLDQIQYENSEEYKHEQLKAGIHPLVVNATYLIEEQELQKDISNILGMYVYTINKHGEKKFLIYQKGKRPKNITPKDLSDLLSKTEKKLQKLSLKLQKDSIKLNKQRQSELKQPFELLDPTTVKQFNWNYDPNTDEGDYFYNPGHTYFTGISEWVDKPESDSLYVKWQKKYLNHLYSQSYNRYSFQYDWKMNGYMRGKDYEYYPEMMDDIKNIEQTIDQFTLPDNIRVYRILADYDNNLDKFLEKVMYHPDSKNTTMIQDLGFSSTSVCWNSIKEWKNEYNRIKLVIDVPKGQGRGAYIQPLSRFPTEFEFLLQHGTVFKVLNIDKSDPTMYELHLQVVGCRPELPSSPPDPEAKSLRKSIRLRRAKSDKHFIADISDFKIVHLN